MNTIKQVLVFLANRKNSEKFLKTKKFSDFTDYENQCLAIGLWEMFKITHLPEFVIGLDKDAESILAQYVFDKNSKLSIVNHTKEKIRIAIELINGNRNIYKFFSQTGFYEKKV